VPATKPGAAIAALLLTWATLTSPARAGTLGAPCLSSRVGDVLSDKLAAHGFDGALPMGWTLEEVGVAGDHIDLGTLDAEKHPHSVSLRLGDAPANAIAGHGRWFAFVIEPAGAPLDDAGRKALVDLAGRVDASVPEDEVRRVCVPGASSDRPTWVVVGALFYALVLAGSLVAAWRCRAQLRSRAAILPAVLTVLALGTRFAAHAGVGDIRQVLEAGVGQGFVPRAGWSALLRVIFTLLPPRYETIWAIHRVVGALAVPLLYCALRQRFPRCSVAAAGATALAVLPLAARFSASDTPYVPLCTAFVGAVVALTQFRQSGSRGALTIGMLLLTAAMHLRPDGPWLAVPAAILALTTDAVPAGRAFSPTTLVAGGVFLALNAVPSAWALAGHNHVGDGSLADYARYRFVLFGTLFGSPWTDLGMSPWPLSLLVLGGVMLAARAGRPGIGWLVATLVAMPLRFEAPEQYANARYHLPSVYLACGLAGMAASYLVERAARRLPVWLDPSIASGALALLAAVPRFDLLTRMWTPQQEFEYYRAGRRKLDPACTVVALMDGQDAGFVPFSDPDVPAAIDIHTFLAGSVKSSCVVYYRSANCRSPQVLGLPGTAPFEENPWCRDLEQQETLVPLDEKPLPARPYRGETYSLDPVPVGFYRLVDRHEVPH